MSGSATSACIKTPKEGAWAYGRLLVSSDIAHVYLLDHERLTQPSRLSVLWSEEESKEHCVKP